MDNNEIILFETEDRMISLPVMVKNETVWLNRNQLSELFERDIKTIGKHINNALKEELSGQNTVVAKFATTASDGKKIHGRALQFRCYYFYWLSGEIKTGH